MKAPNYENRNEYFELFTKKDKFGIPKLNVHPHNLYEWFEDEVNEYAEHYANQRVIEKLEKLRLQAHTVYLGDGYDEFRKIDVEDIDKAIKELKQDGK